MTEPMARTRAEEARKLVKKDILGHIYVADVPEFLDHFFPLDGDCETILERLKNDGIYKDGIWQEQFPLEPDGKEKAYYDPVANILNAIVDKVDEGKKYIKARWFNTSMKSPDAATSNTAKIRPDLVARAGDKDETDKLTQEIDKEDEKQEIEDTHKEFEPAKDDDKKPQLDIDDVQKVRPRLSQKVKKLLQVFWARTMVVLEIKPEDIKGLGSSSYYETLIQLLSYMRYILRDQQDRMFVFGVILFHRKMSVWYCDRSGLLSAAPLIDIDKSPMDFIRVVSGLATMTPEQLGFNPYMKRVVNGQAIPSYDPCIPKEEESKPRDQIKWRFTVSYDGVQRVFESVSLISVARSEVMCGRATLVWNVVDLVNQKACILKSCWRPVEGGEDDPDAEDDSDEEEDEEVENEGESEECQEAIPRAERYPDASVPASEARGREARLYMLMKEGSGHKYLGKLVEAFDLPRTQITSLRRGMITREYPEYKKRQMKDLPTRSKANPQANPSEQRAHHSNVSHFPNFVGTSAKPSQFVDRKLCWMVFETIGWPIKYFLNLHELLLTFRDALKGYQRLYNRGIVHRDLSLGNIIIELEDSGDVPSPTGTSGSLIDLDHATGISSYEAQCLFNDLKDKAREWDNAIQTINTLLKTGAASHRPSPRLAAFLLDVSEGDVFIACSRFITFLKEAKENDYNKMLDARQEVDFADIGFDFNKYTCIPPDFEDRQAEHAFRSCTVPFMSGRLFDKTTTPHMAIHDMESAFWVLLYICLTRCGPGGKRREELDRPVTTSSNEGHKTIHRIVYSLFDTDIETDLIENKQIIFDTDKNCLLETHIFPSLHPYFKPLEGLIRKWWDILIDGYKNPTGAHGQYPIAAFLHAAGAALARLPEEDADPKYDSLREGEIQRRQHDIDRFGKFLRPDPPVVSTPPPTLVHHGLSPNHDLNRQTGRIITDTESRPTKKAKNE